MHAPSWVLLAWSALAATLASLGLRALLPPPRPRGAAHGTSGVRPGRAGAFARDLFLGLLLLPPLYGFAFEALGRADLVAGAALGTAHGLLDAAIRARTASPRGRAIARALTGGIAYGLALGFLYVVPA